MTNIQALAFLAGSHLWQSVAVAAALAVILILGRRMSGAARYGLACAAMAASLALPLAAFAPGAGVVSEVLAMLKAPVRIEPAPPAKPPLSAPEVRLALTPSGSITAAVERPQASAGASDEPSADAVAPAAVTPQAPRAAVPVYGVPLVPLSQRPRPAGFHLPALHLPDWLPDWRVPKLPDLQLPLLVIWLAGAVTLLIRLGVDLVAVERLVARARPVPLPKELARRLGHVRIAISPDAPGPMAAGLIRPSVILPEDIGERIHAPEMAALLEHELAHLERRDVLAALTQRVALALLWWSPAMHWISRRIDEERETACDETAVRRTGDARAFARTLTSQAEAQLWARAPRLAVGAIGRRSQFGRRIKRLVEIARAGGVPEHYSGRLAFTGLAIAIAAAAFLTPKIALADTPDHAKPPSADRAIQPAPLAQLGKLDDASARSSREASQALAGAPSHERDGASDPSSKQADDYLAPALSDLVNTIAREVERSAGDAQPDARRAQELGVQLASLGVEISGLVNQEVLSDLPAILDDVRDQLRDKGIDIDNIDSLSEEDRERLRTDMEKLRDKLKREFGPEFKEKLHRDIEQAEREIERHHADWERSADQRRLAMAKAHEAVARAKREIDAARARGDFNFAFSFSDDQLKDMARTQARAGQPIIVGMRPASLDRRLLDAIEAGDVAKARDLLEKDGADANRIFPGEGSPLILAARHGKADMVRLLLDHGADINRGVRGEGNALSAAAGRGRIDVVKLLLDRGDDVNALTASEETPLLAAAREGELAAVRLLVEHGADVNRSYTIHGRLRSPLGEAQRRGYDDVAAFLRQRGAIADPKSAN